MSFEFYLSAECKSHEKIRKQQGKIFFHWTPLTAFILVKEILTTNSDIVTLLTSKLHTIILKKQLQNAKTLEKFFQSFIKFGKKITKLLHSNFLVNKTTLVL